MTYCPLTAAQPQLSFREYMGFTSYDTPRLSLRRFSEADLPVIAAYRRDPEVRSFQNFRDWTDEDQRKFLAEAQSNELEVPGNGLQIAVALREIDMLIGDVYVRISDEEQAEIGYTFDPAWQNKGYATEAITGLFSYLFGEEGLHRIVAICAVENTRSYALMNRVGMRREAHMKQSYRYHNVWHDEFMYAILYEDWLLLP